MRRNQIAAIVADTMREFGRVDITCEDDGLLRKAANIAGLKGHLADHRRRVLDSLEGNPRFKKSIQPFGRRLRVFTLVG